MAFHNELGRVGEEMACRYLIHNGYSLRSRNWRFHHLEVDIVAEWYGEIVFVEVKTRTDELYMPAADAVDFEKRDNLVKAAKAYMNYYELDQPYRFDIITLVGEAPSFKIEQIVNAFTVQGVSEERFRRKHHIPERS